MNIEGVKEELKNLLVEDIGKAINICVDSKIKKEASIYDEFAQLASRFKRLKNDHRTNIIDYTQRTLSIDRLSKDLIDTINELVLDDILINSIEEKSPFDNKRVEAIEAHAEHVVRSLKNIDKVSDELDSGEDYSNYYDQLVNKYREHLPDRVTGKELGILGEKAHIYSRSVYNVIKVIKLDVMIIVDSTVSAFKLSYAHELYNEYKELMEFRDELLDAISDLQEIISCFGKSRKVFKNDAKVVDHKKYRKLMLKSKKLMDKSIREVEEMYHAIKYLLVRCDEQKNIIEGYIRMEIKK